MEEFFKDEYCNLAVLLLKTIARVVFCNQIPSHVREACINNVILSGGGLMFAGIVDRLREELLQISANENLRFSYLKPELSAGLRFFNYRHPPNIVMWSGGSRE